MWTTLMVIHHRANSHVPMVTTGNGKAALTAMCVPSFALIGHSGHEMLAKACSAAPIPFSDALQSIRSHRLGIEEVTLGITQALAFGVRPADIVGIPNGPRRIAASQARV